MKKQSKYKINYSEHCIVSVEGQKAMRDILEALDSGKITIEQVREATRQIEEQKAAGKDPVVVIVD